MRVNVMLKGTVIGGRLTYGQRLGVMESFICTPSCCCAFIKSKRSIYSQIKIGKC